MLLELLELAGNSALAHDTESLARLERLQGKTMVLHIRPLNQSIAVTPCPEGLEFTAEIPAKPDVKLSATIGAMIKISRDGMDDAELQPGELEIVGDAIVGQRFAQVIAGLDIEWQALLAEHLGETPAQLITSAAGTARDLAEEGKVQVGAYIGKILREDMDIVAEQAEVDEFLDGVDQLRADADRLEARLKKLQRQL